MDKRITLEPPLPASSDTQWPDMLDLQRHANILKESFQKSVSAVLASVVFFAPMQGYAQTTNTVVNVIPGWKIKAGWPYGHIIITWTSVNGVRKSSVCNYFKLTDRQGGSRSGTARHCMVEKSKQKEYNFVDNDIFVSRRLSDETSGRMVLSSDTPKAYFPSAYDTKSIIGRKLTVIGGLPDGSGKNSSLGFSISGKAELVGLDIVVIRMPKGQFREMWKTQWQESINGMSGSPVFDDKGNIFWALSMASYSFTSEYAIVHPLQK